MPLPVHGLSRLLVAEIARFSYVLPPAGLKSTEYDRIAPLVLCAEAVLAASATPEIFGLIFFGRTSHCVQTHRYPLRVGKKKRTRTDLGVYKISYYTSNLNVYKRCSMHRRNTVHSNRFHMLRGSITLVLIKPILWHFAP